MPSLLLPLEPPFPVSSLLASRFKPHSCSLRPSLLSPKPSFWFPLSDSPTSLPDSLPRFHPNRCSLASETLALGGGEEDEDDDELVVGDCLVFEDGAFEGGGDRFPAPDSGRGEGKPRRRKLASAAAAAAEPESLVPEKWKTAVEEINLTKKEKRKIAHELRFGSRMERRKKSPVPDMEEYRLYREMKLSQLNPVVLDDPRAFPPEKEAADLPEAEPGERVAPRNPRLELGGGTMEDITDFFSGGDYVPGEAVDDKKPQGRRKLFTKEEKVLLNKRIPNLTEATSSKWLPLHTLAAAGQFYLLDGLLKHNVNINAVDQDGLSAIHKAIFCKKQAIVNYLLRNSANPFVRDKDGASLIHYAVQTASVHTIKILLLYNVDINLADNDGWTPLHLAVQTRRTDIVRLLLIKGADRNLRNHVGLTPLDLCLYSGRDLRTYELIKLLKGLTSVKSLP